MAKPRLVIVTPSRDRSAGGVERFCHLVAGVAGEDGWEVHLVEPDRLRPRVARTGLGPLIASGSLRRQCRQLRPDLIVTNGWLGAWFGRSWPRVHVFHGTMPGRWGAFGPGDSLRYRLRLTVGSGLAEMVAGIGAYRVAVSSGAAAEVRRWFRYDVHEVVDNAVDTALFRPLPAAAARRQLGLSETERYALLVGNTEHRKGSDLLVAACRQAGWTAVTAGGELPGARSLGRLDGEHLVQAYNSADAVVFPSRYEGASLGLLEALACGATVLMSEVGSVPMLVGRLPALRDCVVDPSVEGLARGLRRVATDPAHYRDVAGQAQELVRRQLDLEAFAAHWREVLRRSAPLALGVAPAPPPLNRRDGSGTLRPER